MFCPKCGSLLMPKLVKGKKILACSCGYRSEGEMSLSDKKKKVEKDVEVIDEEAEQNVMPLVEIKCNKCGHNKAYFWEVQTRAGDEPPTKFFKCEKCKHTWRDYS
jgi:DNA-directed RNA polymerase subunit M